MAWGYLWDSDGVCRGEFYNRVEVKIRDFEHIRLVGSSRINLKGGAICWELF